MAQTLGLKIVSAKDNDNICASISDGRVILFFGKYKLAGGLEVRIRSQEA